MTIEGPWLSVDEIAGYLGIKRIQFTSGLTRRDCQRVEELVEREAKK